jgi:AcrR family transcriptional regulator
MKAQKSAYHHGDLRAALVEAGLKLLHARSADDLSLREVARAVGVSPTAVYRHFADKQQLLYALCEEGISALANAQRTAMRSAKKGPAAFEATGRAYVRFALENPALYRLMMATRSPQKAKLASAEENMDSAMQLLRDNIAALLPDKASPKTHAVAALHAWSMVHGLSMLMLDGLVDVDHAMIRSVVRWSPSGTEEK